MFFQLSYSSQKFFNYTVLHFLILMPFQFNFTLPNHSIIVLSSLQWPLPHWTQRLQFSCYSGASDTSDQASHVTKAKDKNISLCFQLQLIHYSLSDTQTHQILGFNFTWTASNLQPTLSTSSCLLHEGISSCATQAWKLIVLKPVLISFPN